MTRRRKDKFEGIRPPKWVAYDYRCLFELTPLDLWLLKHLPTLYFRRWKVRERARAEIKALYEAGYNVEVIFWEPTVKHLMAARSMEEKISKADPDLHTLYVATILAIRERGYETFFTSRQEVLAMFPSEFARLTQIQTGMIANKIMTEKAAQKKRER